MAERVKCDKISDRNDNEVKSRETCYMRKSSLSRLTIVVQIAIFSVVIVLLLLFGFYFHMQTRREAEMSANVRLEDVLDKIGERMNADEVQVREMLHRVGNSKDLWSDDKEKKYFAKIALQNSVADKMLFYEDMEFLFIGRKDDYFLTGNASVQTGSEKLEFQDYVTDHMEDIGSASRGKKWVLRNIAGNYYCFFVCPYINEEIYVGVGLPCKILCTDLFEFVEESDGWIKLTDSQKTEYWDNFQADHRDRNAETITISGSLGETGLVAEGEIKESILKYMHRTTVVSIVLLSIMCIASVMIQYYILRKTVILPVTALADEAKDIADGSRKTDEIHIQEGAFLREIDTLQKALNYLLREVFAAKIKLYEKKMQEQDIQLRMLRAQLKPHFYLNAIMTVNSMTYQNRNEDIREYLSCFSKYMRYMMKINTNMVLLKDELKHIQNYINMQKIKFPSSVIAMIECPENLEKEEIPHLLLFTVVENAFKHAMNLKDTLEVFIVCEATETSEFSGYCVSIEDNGPGFDRETMEYFNREEQMTETQEAHIGLNNVKSTLILKYHRRDLFKISNVIPNGAKVEICIPKEAGKWD